MKLNQLLILALLLLTTASDGIAQEGTAPIQAGQEESSLRTPSIKDLNWVSFLTPLRNINAGELLHENDFDQVAVGNRQGEDIQGFIQANIGVEGKYALVDLYKGRQLEVGSIGEQRPPNAYDANQRGQKGFADELAWFSYEYLEPGATVSGSRLQLKRIRRDSIPGNALPPGFKPPGQFKVLKGISPDLPIVKDQIELVE